MEGKYSQQFWDTLATYSGELLDVYDNDEFTIEITDTFVRYMTIFEKKLYTLYRLKCDERDRLIESIAGIHPRSVTSRLEKANMTSILYAKSTHEQRMQIDEHWRAAIEFQRGLREFVTNDVCRLFCESTIRIKLRRGWKVYVGFNTLNISQRSEFIVPPFYDFTEICFQ